MPPVERGLLAFPGPARRPLLWTTVSDSAAPTTGHRAARVRGRERGRRGRRGAAGQPRRGALAAHGARRAWRSSWRRSPAGSRSTPGSKDESRDAARGRLRRRPGGRGAVVHDVPRRGPARASSGWTSSGSTTEWVWLLHDDASPHPEALLALLAGAAEDPDADVLGPMLREWPSLKAVLELGVTISGTGRRETGLERGEYDQGQYAEVRPVLAVNTAGHAGPAPGPRGARRVRRRAADVRQRPRLRLAGRERRPPHGRGAAGGRLPRRGRAPRRPARPR